MKRPSNGAPRRTAVAVRPSASAAAVMNALRRTVLALRMWSQEAEGHLGISGAQLFVLQQLAAAPAETLTELARRTLTSKASVSVVVSRLVDRGLVSRRISATDRRSVVLALTPAGERTQRRGPASPQQRLLGALGRLPPRELTAFARLFERFVDELGISALEPAMLFDGEVTESRSSVSARRATGGIR